MYSLYLSGGGEGNPMQWGWDQPTEGGGSTFTTNDFWGNGYPGPGFVNDSGMYMAAPPPPPPPAASGGGGSPAAGTGASASAGTSNSGSGFDWSTGRPRKLRDDLSQAGWEGGGSYWAGADGIPVDDPYRDVTLDELKAAGLWQNVGDPANSPYWQALQQNWSGMQGPDAPYSFDYLTSNPHGFSQELLSRSGIDPYDTGYTVKQEDLEKAFGGQGVSQPTIDDMLGTLTSRVQSVLAGPDIFDKAGDEIMPALASFFPVIGPIIAGAMRAELASEDNSWSSMAKNMVGGGIKGYVAGQIGQGMFGGGPADSSWLNEVDAVPASMNPADVGQIAGANAANGFQVADLGSVTDISPGLFNPDALDQSLIGPNAGASAGSGSFYAPDASVFNADALDASLAGSQSGSTMSPNVQEAAGGAPTQTAQQQQQQQRQKIEQLRQYANTAMKIKDALGLVQKPEGAPEQGEGESDQQYSTELVNYLGLDNDTMAATGLEPGSPAYMNYIMDQADSIISQVLGDINVDSADLAAQLRGKSAEEMQQLQRALFVRGALDARMGAGTYADPLSGQMQEVAGPGMFNTNVAAAQRGWAGDVNDLAGLRGNDALSKIRGMLSRNRDPFGAQAAQDKELEDAKRNEQDQEAERRRRGMLSRY